MFKIFQKKEIKPTLLDEVIEEALQELKSLTASDPEYAKIVQNLRELHEMQQADKPKRRVSPDVIVGIASNLLGIGMIMSFEKANVITTKAFGMITKPKI